MYDFVRDDKLPSGLSEYERIQLSDWLFDHTFLYPCPKCGGSQIHWRIKHVNSRSGLLTWICESCGHEWSDCRIENGDLVFGGGVSYVV